MLPGVIVGSSSTLFMSMDPRHGLPGSNSGTKSNAFDAVCCMIVYVVVVEVAVAEVAMFHRG